MDKDVETAVPSICCAAVTLAMALEEVCPKSKLPSILTPVEVVSSFLLLS